MRTIPFEGKHLRVWSTAELAAVRQVAAPGAGEHVSGSGGLEVARGGSPVLVFESACHPTLTLVNNPAHLVAEYWKQNHVLLLRCHVCRAPVMAFEVA